MQDYYKCMCQKPGAQEVKTRDDEQVGIICYVLAWRIAKFDQRVTNEAENLSLATKRLEFIDNNR